MTTNFSGKLGGTLVFQKNGVVRTRPDCSKTKWTEAQLEHRRRFEMAKRFARAVIADPERKAAYAARAKKGTGAYQVAIAEYMEEQKQLDLQKQQKGSET